MNKKQSNITTNLIVTELRKKKVEMCYMSFDIDKKQFKLSSPKR